jgi:hypothetical protein
MLVWKCIKVAGIKEVIFLSAEICPMYLSAGYTQRLAAKKRGVNETIFVNQQSKFNEINFVSHFARHVLLGAVISMCALFLFSRNTFTFLPDAF